MREDVDSGAFILPQTLNNLRSWETGFTFDLPRLLRGMAGDSGGIARALGRVRPFDVSRRVQRTSTYDLAAFNPSLSYMLALGGLETTRLLLASNDLRPSGIGNDGDHLGRNYMSHLCATAGIISFTGPGRSLYAAITATSAPMSSRPMITR